MHAYEQEHKMPYITSFERLAREEGLEQGRYEELLNGLELALDVKFADAGRQFFIELREITDIAKLRAVQKAIRTAKTIDDLRAVLQ
jgi:hypothetical protein